MSRTRVRLGHRTRTPQGSRSSPVGGSQVSVLRGSQNEAVRHCHLRTVKSCEIETVVSSEMSALEGSQIKTYINSQMCTSKSSQTRVLESTQIETRKGSQIKTNINSQMSVSKSTQIETRKGSQIKIVKESQFDRVESSQTSEIESSRLSAGKNSQMAMLEDASSGTTKSSQIKILENSIKEKVTNSEMETLKKTKLGKPENSQLFQVENLKNGKRKIGTTKNCVTGTKGSKNSVVFLSTILRPEILALVFLGFCAAAAAEQDVPGLYFTTEPQDGTVRRLSAASLHCSVSSSPAAGGGAPAGLEVSWLKDGQLLDPKLDPDRWQVLENHTLHLPAVGGGRGSVGDRSDEGSYQCRAAAPLLGVVLSAPALLSVARLGRLGQVPRIQEAHVGDKAHFPCSPRDGAAGREGRVVWHRDGAPVRGDSRMSVLPSGALEIDNLVLADAGIYHCHLEYLGRVKVSDAGELRVTPAPPQRPPAAPVFIARPPSLAVRAGETVVLDCAANAHPPPAGVWLRDGATLDLQALDGRHRRVGATWALEVRDVRAEDEGAYMCRASNAVDSVDAIAHLTVYVPPHMEEAPPPVVEGSERGDALLPCRVGGRPTPRVVWYKDGEVIRYSEYFQAQGHALRILGLVPGDAGMYQCFGTNVAGTTQRTTRLVVTADGGGGEEAADGAEVTSAAPPTAPRDVRPVAAAPRRLTLAWRPPPRGAGVRGYRVLYRREGSAREREAPASEDGAVLDELTPNSTYVVSVAADYGDVRGPPSPPVRVHTRADQALPPAPRELVVTPTSPTELLVTWDPPQLGEGSDPITGYRLYYMPVGSGEEQQVEVGSPPSGGPPPTTHRLPHLAPYTHYSVWVTALNGQGEGPPTAEGEARTLSDVPSAPPAGVRLEPASSQSIIVRWEPPPLEHQNGVITGYKIRVRARGGGGGGGDQPAASHTADGTRRLYALTGLARHTPYSVRVSALTVNGSGPATPWLHTATLPADPHEPTVPGVPASLTAHPKSTTISVRWEPPGGGVLVRGYTLGWGKGIPDVYTKIVDSNRRRFTIDGLEPSSEYVISVRAFNGLGDGRPVYEQVNTRPPEQEAPHRPLPPLALKTEVLTPFSVALSWTPQDPHQYTGERSHYTVRYTTYASGSSSSPRYRYVNATDVRAVIDSLKPATMYEFAVRAVRGGRESRWSLVATSTTLEARPASPPRDVTVVTIRGQPSTVVVNWQPPRLAHGRITGYTILYTADPSLPWGVEEVAGDRLSHPLTPLTPATTYHFRLQARNSVGVSPQSPVANFTTLPATAATPTGGGGLWTSRGVVVGVGVGVGGVLLILGGVILGVLYCRRGEPVHTDPTARGGGSAKGEGSAPQPPDLWIHHDRLELTALRGSRPPSPPPTGGPDDPPEGTTYTSTSTLDRRTPYHSAYLRDGGEEAEGLLHRLPPRGGAPPLYLVGGSTSSSVYSEGTLGRPPPPPQPLTAPPYPPLDPYAATGEGSSTLGKGVRGAPSGGVGPPNPLRSFSAPAPPPPQSAPTTPHPKHYGGGGPPPSPFKKLPPSAPHLSLLGPPPVGGRRVLPPIQGGDPYPDPDVGGLGRAPLGGGVSTEQLSQEMAHLEGLMRDLSQITESQLS